MEKYNVEIIKDGRIAWIVLPFNAKEAYNKAKGTIYVKGTINNIPYRVKLTSKGNGKQIMIVNKALQKKIGFSEGRMVVDLTIEEDCMEAKATEASRIVSKSNIDLLSGIMSRRSIRSYTGKELNEEHINTILNAGFCAPSAKNKRPWHFIVVKNKERLNAISLINTNNSMISNASCCVVVCGDKVKQGINELLIEDCSVATQNMLLATHGLGLGGVWCGVLKNSDTYKYLKDVLELPESIIPISIVVLGYPNEVKSEVARFEEGKTHREVWNNR